MKRIGNETFAESIELYAVPDVSTLVATGHQGPDRRELWRGTYRLHFKDGAVYWELLATVHARLMTYEMDDDGEIFGVFVARNRYGRSFTFRLAQKHFQSTRHITRAVMVAGGIGSLIVPDKARAFLRAVLYLSKEKEPMPHTSDEIAALSCEEENDFEEVDPFNDDVGF